MNIRRLLSSYPAFALFTFAAAAASAVAALPTNEVPVKEVKVLELPGRQSWNGFTWYPGTWWVNSLKADPRAKKIWLATNIGLMALDPDAMALQRWTTFDGLPDSCVNDMAVDDKGTVWAATYNGASRMDKRGFKNWSGKEVGYHNLSRIALDRDGRAWVGCTGRKPMGAMCLAPDGQWVIYSKWALDAEAVEAVSDIQPDNDGGVWIAGVEGKGANISCEGYYAPQSPRLLHVDPYGAPQTIVLDNSNWPERIAVEQSGYLLVLPRDGKLRRLMWGHWFDDGKRRVPDLIDVAWQDMGGQAGIPAHLNDIFRDEDGRVWLAADKEIGYLDGGKYVAAIRLPPAGRLLNHFTVMKGGRCVAFSVNPTAQKDREYFEYKRGVFLWNGNDWRFITTRNDGPSEQFIFGVAGRDVIRGDLHFIREFDQVFDGKRWSVGKQESGRYVYTKGTWGKFVSMQDGISFIYDRYGRVVANCTWDGEKREALLWVKGKEKPVTHKEFFGVNLFPAMYRDSLGHYWHYSDELQEFDGKKIIDHSAANPFWFRKIAGVGNYNQTVRGIAEDDKGRLWVATTWGVLLYENRSTWKWVGGRFDGMHGMLGWHFASNGRDVMDFAGTWGVTEFNMLNGEWANWVMKGLDIPGYTQKLPGSYAEAVTADIEGRMWYGTLEGGACYHDTRTGEQHYLTTADGLATSSILGIWCDDDGTMWFTSQSGIQKLDMTKLGRSSKP